MSEKAIKTPYYASTSLITFNSADPYDPGTSIIAEEAPVSEWVPDGDGHFLPDGMKNVYVRDNLTGLVIYFGNSHVENAIFGSEHDARNDWKNSVRRENESKPISPLAR